MRILHLSTGINRQSAAYRLHKALLNNGIDSFIYSGLGPLEEENVFVSNNKLSLKIKARMERQLLKLYPNREIKPWNLSFFNNIEEEIIELINPDIIHLHWINQFVSIQQLKKFNVPLVWTMHDSWPFTGGCHIPGMCDKYKSGCGICPQLNSNKNFDLSKYIYNHKFQSWKNLQINFIGPSRWITEEAKASKLLNENFITNLPNCIDLQFYSPKDQINSRKKLGLPLDKKLILFGANNALKDYNKGFDLLESSFKMIISSVISEEIELVVFGTKETGYCEKSKIRMLGYIDDPKLFPLIYSSANVLVSPSRSENFSNVILESLACGTPVVAFNIGGNSDLINQKNGALAKPYETNDLAEKIDQILNSKLLKDEISYSVNEFSYSRVGSKMVEFYYSVL